MSHASSLRPPRKALFRRRTAPGAVPGTVDTDPSAHKSVLQVFSFGAKEAVEEPVPGASRLKSLMGRRAITWINVVGLGDAETIHEVGRAFRLHPLAMEDVVNTHQQPKVELYGDRLFLVMRVPRQNEKLSTEQVSLFA